VLGPLLFLILINDLPNASNLLLTLLFADDTTLQLNSSDVQNLFNTANSELSKVAEWFRANKLTLNLSKTKYILFKQPSQHVDFSNLKLGIDNVNIERIGLGCEERAFKFVGMYLDEHLTWNNHINHVRSKVSMANYAISKVKYIFPEKVKVHIYNSLVQSYLGYGLEAWGGVMVSKLKPIFMIQKSV
jgi:hypothetical protein